MQGSCGFMGLHAFPLNYLSLISLMHALYMNGPINFACPHKHAYTYVCVCFCIRSAVRTSESLEKLRQLSEIKEARNVILIDA